MSKKKKSKRGFKGCGDGSPIETRCRARGSVEVDRRKRASKNACRRKGRQAREWGS